MQHSDLQYGDGFYAPENDGVRDFRWMQGHAHLQLGRQDNKKCFTFSIGNPYSSTVFLTIKSQKNYVVAIDPGWHHIIIPIFLLSLDAAGCVTLVCDRRLQVEGEERELSLMIGDIRQCDQILDKGSIIFKSGFYEAEHDGIRNYRWMKQNASLFVNPEKNQWLIFEVGFPGTFPTHLTVTRQNITTKFSIINGWQQLAVDFPLTDSRPCMVSFESDAEHQATGDKRSLSLMIGSLHLAQISDYERNSCYLHRALFKDIKTKAFPTFFTFETSAICNMKCNMCVVDQSLKSYDISRIKTTDKTDYLYDELLPYATKLQLHATGEVLTGKDFWKALNKVSSISQKRSLEVEIFTNGQLLNEENIYKIINSHLTDIVISMDAATEKTYTRIRGGDFNHLCKNIKNLVAANKKYRKLRIALGMILMRENIEELPKFIDLAKSLEVETVTFWPLFAVGMRMPPKIAKDGFPFYYRQQMLINYPNITQNMISCAMKRAGELSIHIGVTPCFSKDYRQFHYEDLPYPLSYEEFCKVSGDLKRKKATDNEEDIASLKACYLPWNTAFITTEGKFAPCLLMTYLGGIDSVIGKNFFKDVWNGEIMQELRQSIIDGKPHRLCKNSQCIFVNKLY